MSDGNIFCAECKQRFLFFLPRQLSGTPEITITSCWEKYQELCRKDRSTISEVESYLFFALQGRVKSCRGKKNEELVTVALRELQKEGKIRSFYAQDSYGVDFTVVRSDGKEVPLQVKSSPRFVAKHRCRHPDIPVIGVYRRYESSPQSLKEKVANVLSL